MGRWKWGEVGGKVVTCGEVGSKIWCWVYRCDGLWSRRKMLCFDEELEIGGGGGGR